MKLAAAAVGNDELFIAKIATIMESQDRLRPRLSLPKVRNHNILFNGKPIVALYNKLEKIICEKNSTFGSVKKLTNLSIWILDVLIVKIR
jgi:hypothetical protein